MSLVPVGCTASTDRAEADQQRSCVGDEERSKTPSAWDCRKLAAVLAPRFHLICELPLRLLTHSNRSLRNRGELSLILYNCDFDGFPSFELSCEQIGFASDRARHGDTASIRDE